MNTHKTAANVSNVKDTARSSQVLGSAMITQLMIVLDMTVIAIALPQMQDDLVMTSEQSPWVITAYSLAFGGLVLFGGRLTAILGIRRAYQIGLIGFAAASLAAGFAPSFAMLVIARTTQGAFAAVLAPTLLAMINRTFTNPAARAKAFGALGATGGLGAAVGLIVGGTLTDALDWRWCLYVNVPIAMVALLVSLRSLPPSTQRDRDARITEDILGLGLGCGAIFSLVFGLNQAQQHEWTAASTLYWLTAGGVLSVLFVVREWSVRHPVLPLWIVVHPARAASYAIQFINGAAQMGAFLYLTYYFQNSLGYSPLRTGVMFLPMVVTLALTAAISSRLLVPWLGAKGIFPLGLAVQATSFVVFSHMTVESTYAEVALPALLIYGIGVGLVMPMSFNAGTRGVGENQAGLASAVISASQQIGSSFGVALLATYATHRMNNYIETSKAAIRADIIKALVQAQATPNTAAGQQIIEQMKEQARSSAQIAAYSGGFTLLAWILAISTALLLISGLSLAVYQQRTRE